MDAQSGEVYVKRFDAPGRHIYVAITATSTILDVKRRILEIEGERLARPLHSLRLSKREEPLAELADNALVTANGCKLGEQFLETNYFLLMFKAAP
jgi:hypothetical protein